jgi:hypothetical protein
LKGGKLCENAAREKNIMTEVQTRPRVKNVIVFMSQSLSYQLIFYQYFLIKEMAQSFSSYSLISFRGRRAKNFPGQYPIGHLHQCRPHPLSAISRILPRENCKAEN